MGVRFAYLFIEEGFDPKIHRATLSKGGSVVTVVGVPHLEAAKQEARALWKEEGVQAIEVCGAFGEEGARAVMEATQQQVAVGYVVHFPQQDELFRKVFGH